MQHPCKQILVNLAINYNMVEMDHNCQTGFFGSSRTPPPPPPNIVLSIAYKGFIHKADERHRPVFCRSNNIFIPIDKQPSRASCTTLGLSAFNYTLLSYIRN